MEAMLDAGIIRETHDYEYAYTGYEFQNTQALLEAIDAVCMPESGFAHWNVPVWIDLHSHSSTLEVGILLTEHGRPTIWHVEHCETDGETVIRQLRERMVRIWTYRSEHGFARHVSVRPNESRAGERRITDDYRPEA